MASGKTKIHRRAANGYTVCSRPMSEVEWTRDDPAVTCRVCLGMIAGGAVGETLLEAQQRGDQPAETEAGA